MLPPTRRVNYFEYQLLHVDDFIDEQAYHLGMRRAHNRMMHSWGVVQGLELSHVGPTVTVSEGMALDETGCEVVLAKRFTLDMRHEPAGVFYLTIAYGEKGAEHTSETGTPGDRRIEEEPRVCLTQAPPGDPGIHLVLGRVTVGDAGLVANTDGGDVELGPLRRVAGPAPFVELEAKTLSVKGTAAVHDHLTASGALTVAGTATLSGPVTVGNRLTVSGGIGFDHSGTADQRLYAPKHGTLRWQTNADAPHAVEVGLEEDGKEAVRVHLDAKGPSYLTGGRLGVGVATPAATLHVAGGKDPATTDGDLMVGTAVNKLKIGVQVEGAESPGTARLRAEGGVAKLVLGAAGADVLTVDGTGVQIGSGMASIEGYRLSVIGRLNATELRQGGKAVVNSRWSTTDEGISYDGDVGIGGVVRLTDKDKTDSYPMRVNLATGNIGLHAVPDNDASLVVNGNVRVTGDVTVRGLLSQKDARKVVSSEEPFTQEGDSWTDIPGMIVDVEPGWHQIGFSMGGVYLPGPVGTRTDFEFFLDPKPVDGKGFWADVSNSPIVVSLHIVTWLATSGPLVVRWWHNHTPKGTLRGAGRSLIVIRL
jgi:hypothetical protein